MEVDLKGLSREERGRLLARKSGISKTELGWSVPSQTDNNLYLVRFDGCGPTCNCKDYQIRDVKCKHIHAVEFHIMREVDKNGSVTVTKKVMYSQKWTAYNTSQTNEKLVLMKLLKDLASNVKQPEYKFGRPTLPFSDMVFGSVMKIYSTFSLRRFISDMKIAKEMGLVDKVPCYSTISNFMNREELTSILRQLIQLSSLPLKEVEEDFAIDSSGFSTSRFARWFDHKWGKETKYRVWIKAHLCSGVKTNIVTSVEITEGTEHDTKQLPALIQETAKNFNLSEVSADKAYSSKKNLALIDEAGAVPFILFKKNATDKRVGSYIWKKMYHYFMYKHDEFLNHYHKRSNAETVFHMIKTKFKGDLRSKCKTAQINELLCKVLCHNICVIIQEIMELGIKAEFQMEISN